MAASDLALLFDVCQKHEHEPNLKPLHCANDDEKILLIFLDIICAGDQGRCDITRVALQYGVSDSTSSNYFCYSLFEFNEFLDG